MDAFEALIRRADLGQRAGQEPGSQLNLAFTIPA
jgi:hypothetical protein